MNNAEKFKEVFGFMPDTETMIPVCPPRGVECPFMDDGIYSECHCELWWGREYKEPTTKNNLGVDCISRQDVLSEIIRFSTEEGSSVECQQLYCDVNNMPSVTPQEPCDKCEVGNPCLYCKHEFETQESEDTGTNEQHSV